MAGEVDVCLCCSDNFVVNSKFIECKKCNLKFHLMCVSIKDSWLKIINEHSNILWFCDECNNKCKSWITKKVPNNADEKTSILAAENKLYQKLVKEMEEKNLILQENCALLKEKGNFHQKNNHSNINLPKDGNIVSEMKTDNYKQTTNSTPISVPSYSGVTNTKKQNENVKSKHNQQNTTTTKTNNNHQEERAQPDKKKNSDVTLSQVNTAVLQAQTSNTMTKLQHLDNPILSGENNSEWHHVKRRTRRFLVGRNETNNQVQAVPKYASLHVSRLLPSTKADQLKAFLEPNFPGVTCEEHPSKRPELYGSMKVTIKQDDFKKAWQREIWPNGALVSKFFVKRRVLETTTDPQAENTNWERRA